MNPATISMNNSTGFETVQTLLCWKNDGLPPGFVLPDTDAEWYDLAAAMSEAKTWAMRLAVYRTARTFNGTLPDPNAFVCNDTAGTKVRLEDGRHIEMPPLPDRARLDPDLGSDACPWLDTYVGFSRTWSPRSFEGFHEAVGLWVLSTVAARRVRFHFGRSRFTNLYIMLAGRTTVHAKTTAAEIGKAVLESAGLSYLLASDQATPPAFIKSLTRSDLPHYYSMLDDEQRIQALQRIAFNAQRGWYYEEFGSGIAAMMRKGGSMADFRGLLRAFDDCPRTYSRETISRGIETVTSPYLALIGNLTPADLRPMAKRGSQLWGDGFLARFAIITPPESEIKRGRFPKGQRTIPNFLITKLIDWHKRLGVPSVNVDDVLDEDGEPTGEKQVFTETLPVRALAISESVVDAYYQYDDALREIMLDYRNTDLDGNYGRLGEKALRIAALFASLQDSDIITLAHFARAQAIVERWRLYTHRIYDQVNQRGVSEREAVEDKALRAIKRWQGTEKYPDGMTAAQVARYIRGYATNELETILDALERTEVLAKHRPKRAWKYYIPNSNGL